MKSCEWQVKEADMSAANGLSSALSINPVVANVLAVRGFSDDEKTRQFLNTDLNDLAPPFEMKGAEQCCERIAQAAAKKERVLVYGDYDVDGITATSILMRFFQTCGLQADFFIPDRIEDGYGIKADSAQKAAEKNPELIITVDCGITAVEPVAALRKKGIDVIITDHHIPSPVLPDTPYIFNPVLSPGTPYEALSAAGVAFKIAWGAAQKICGTHRVSTQFRKFLVESLPLAAVGAVADIVILTGENRILVSEGLSLLTSPCPNKGLNALMEKAGLKDSKNVTAFDIGFKIGPRLNAAGRMDNASKCVELLTTDSYNEAVQIADSLEKHNRERQKLCETTYQEAADEIQNLGIDEWHSIIIGRNSWHRGIIGIIASRIAERYMRPSIVLCRDANDDSLWHGSGRSIGDFHITNALKECGDLLVQFGGHQGAAGLSVREENIQALRKEFDAVADRTLTEESLQRVFEIDAVAAHEYLDISLARDIKKLEPFGEGNSRPLLLTRDLTIARSPRLVGSNEAHLKLQFVAGPGTTVSAIGFNMGNRLKEIIDAEKVDVVYFPDINEWKGRSSLDLHLKDIKESTHVQ